MDHSEALRKLVSDSTNLLHSIAAPHEFASPNGPRRFYAKNLRDLLLKLIEEDGPEGWEYQLKELMDDRADEIAQAEQESSQFGK